MSLRALLSAHGGYRHRRDLLESGWSPDRLRRAARAEGIALLRRSWLVLPEAPAEVHAAARLGGRITCRSALEQHGLWCPPGPADGIHIALAPNARAVEPGVRAHWASPVVAVAPRTLLDPIENVLACIAVCADGEAAFAVWESALARTRISADAMARTKWGSVAARALAAEAGVRSDSGVESRFAYRCRRAGIPFRQQVWLAGRPVDALIGRRLVVQLDGFAFHSDARQRRADIAHDRALRLLGFTVFRFDYVEVMHDWDHVESSLRSAMAQGLHL